MYIEDPVPQYTYFVNKIKELFPDLAYLHVTEPRFVYLEDRDPKDEVRVFSPAAGNVLIDVSLPVQ